jgi:hypothetical protein
MSVIRIQIGFVSDLQPDEIVAEYLLTLFCNPEAEVGSIVERYAKVPSNIDKG